ncbi:hypothetical protein BV25DRAFT_1250019 [Artomyces pyxidatus]|uniref:Uncharacterized protein n=1 Tax=Artomyces pyxidatus TaxID=48021 RepID=A0ACB8TEM4_9AGAM|nr:hypothetical protein BV25DRAFT_1250019 [Artomyces pyxidatus]
MKFARYLDDAQTPEWKKAYIDYHGLKKRIAAIRRAREELNREKAQQSETDDTEVEVPNADLKNDTGDGGEDADDEHEVVGRDAQDEIRSSIRARQTRYACPQKVLTLTDRKRSPLQKCQTAISHRQPLPPRLPKRLPEFHIRADLWVS